MEQTKKPSTLKAVLMCILACLAGGLVFGIIYYIGYYIYYITALEIVFGVLAFIKVKQSTSKGNITIGIILSTLLVVLFNFAAVFLCDTIAIANETGLPFNVVFNARLELWKTDQETIAYLNQRLLEIGGMALLGLVIAIFMVIANVRKTKKQQELLNAQQQTQNYSTSLDNNDYTSDENNPTQENISLSQQNNKIEAQNIYFQYYSQCKIIVNQYLSDKDMTIFKQNINNLKQSISSMPADIKENVNAIIKTEKTNPNLSPADKKTLEIMDRMFI